MPHYSDLYSLPSASALCLPHYNSSSLNFLSYSKPITRYPHLYKPHLSTISEISLPYRRINTPKIYPSDISSRPIKVINTADIDVSVNKYKKFEKKGPRLKLKDNSYTAEPTSVTKEAKPNPGIKRDRATVRLRTVHKDTLKEEIGAFRKWRENFEPEELTNDNKIKKKTKGEILKEKFLIRSRSKENIQALALENKKKTVKKTSSFRDICDAITSDNIDEELNPGQPEEIQRRQSKQLSSENLFQEIRRVSTELSPEDLKDLNVMLSSQNDSVDSSDGSLTLYELEESPEILNNNLNVKQYQDDSLFSTSPVTINIEKAGDIFENESLVKPRELLQKYDIPLSPVLKVNIRQKNNEPNCQNKQNENKNKPVSLEEKNKHDIKSSIKKENIVSNEGLPKHRLYEIKANDNKAKIDTLKKQIEIGKLKQTNLQSNQLKSEILEDKNITTKGVNIFNTNKKISGNPPKDISNVEIEQIKFKPKPLITLNVEDIDTPKKTLVAVVNEVAEEKSIIKNKDKKLKFHVSVNIENVKKKDGNRCKVLTGSIKKGTAFHPLPEKTLINKVVVTKPKLYKHRELKELKLKKSIKTTDQILEKPTNIDSNYIENQNIPKEILVKPKVTKQSINENINLIEINEPHHNLKSKSKKSVVSGKKIIHSEEHNSGRNKIEKEDSSTKMSDAESSLQSIPPKVTSKLSLIQKSIIDDPDLSIFVPPPEPDSEPEPDISKKEEVFVPLQSNRLSQWMHPWAKPEQYDECPVEIFARPKVIRSRHYPRPRKRNGNVPLEITSSSLDKESDSDDDTLSEETSASSRSNDSGFGSTIPEKINANLDNLPSDDTECETGNHDVNDILEAVKKSGKIVPPATTIPRFKKYGVDDFEFIKVLGKGSFGKVLLAKLKETEYYYAVKCLKKDAIVEDNDVECTLIERKVLALGTKHPFLCHLLCTFQTESHLFFTMELLNGGDLMFHITTGGCFPEEQAKFYSAEVISGLQFLHSKGIIYRDLKLDNIIVDFDGHVRLADFGMCKLQIFLDRMAESFCGTPDYMAPEIIKGQHYNQAVDWWSFGVLLYELLLGQSPFSGCDEDELFWSICNEKPVLPKHLSTYAIDILTLLLEKDQTKRLGTRFCLHGPIREHRFYQTINWTDLEARQVEPPFKPYLVHPLDTQYFDLHFTKETVRLSDTEVETGGEQIGTIDQSQFLGFSYTNPNACDK